MFDWVNEIESELTDGIIELVESIEESVKQITSLLHR